MATSVYRSFGGTGLIIENPKGRVKIKWEEIESVAQRLGMLGHANDMIEMVNKANEMIENAAGIVRPAERDNRP